MQTGGGAGVILKIVKGEKIGTTFIARHNLQARKCWIAFGTKCRGKMIIDDGAIAALTKKGKSLLPSGIIAADGNFKAGDTVSLVDANGKEIGRGLTYYSSDQIEKIKGKKTSETIKILENEDYEEVIHRDNLVIL